MMISGAAATKFVSSTRSSDEEEDDDVDLVLVLGHDDEDGPVVCSCSTLSEDGRGLCGDFMAIV